MNLVELAQDNLNFYAPQFGIQINGQALPPNAAKTISSVTVEEKVDLGNSFTLKLNDEYDLANEKFRWLDHQLFKEGNEVTVTMGYSDNLFFMATGKINRIESSFFMGEIPTLTISGEDLSYDYLKRSSQERVFVNQTYSEIARIIAKGAQLIPIVDETGNYESVLYKTAEQNYYRFLLDLAEKADREFRLDGNFMYFSKPRDDQNEILTLELGRDILSFSPKINTTGLVSEVVVRGHNPSNPGVPIIGRATAGSERGKQPLKKTGSEIAVELFQNKTKIITNIIVKSVEHANAIAAAELNKASDSLIDGEVECFGIPQLRLGVNIRLDKMGTRLNGKYYVTGTTHTIDDSGYRTSFRVKRNSI